MTFDIRTHPTYPTLRIDESLSTMGMQSFSLLLIWDRVSGRYHLESKTGRKWDLLASWDCFKGKGCLLAYAMRQPHSRLMSQALPSVTKMNGNLVMCYVYDVVIATPTIEDHIEHLDKVFACMKRTGLECKQSNCEISKVSKKSRENGGQKWHQTRSRRNWGSSDWEMTEDWTSVDELCWFRELQ